MEKRNTLLIVDDMRSNRAFLRNILEDSYELMEAENGEQALTIIREKHDDLAAVLLDIVMPIKDGYQVLQELNEDGISERLPIIVITSTGTRQNESRLLKLGASDIISKPYDPYVLRRRVNNLVSLNRHKWHLEELVTEQANAISQTNEAIVNTLSAITEFRNMESGQHILRIRTFTKILLEAVACIHPEYNLDEKKIATISSASALHDVGKISIPDAILNKPGRLTDEEYQIMKSHPMAGCRILEGMTGVGDQEYMDYAYSICRYHHERWDGRGYPDGLKGNNIPLCAQIVALADVYDALTTKRVYKDPYGHEKSINMILNGECGLFNPMLLECLKQVQSEFANVAAYYADGHAPSSLDIRPIPTYTTSTSSTDGDQQALAKYHTLLNYVGGTVLEVDMDHGIYHLVYGSNPAFSSLLVGDTFREAFTNLATNAVYKDDWTVVMEQYSFFTQYFFEQGLRKYSRHYRIFNSDTGDYVWYESTILRINMDNPNLHRAMIIWSALPQNQVPKNIQTPSTSKYKWSEEVIHNLLGRVLRCRNDKWFTIVDGIDDIASMLGYTIKELDELFQNRLVELVQPEDREFLNIQAQEQLSRGNSLQIEFRLRHKDGHTIWILNKSRLLVAEDGIEYIYCAIINNSRLKESEAHLRKVMERHRLVLQQTDDVIFEWDLPRHTLEMSENFEKLFGYPIRTVSVQNDGSTWLNKIHPEDIPVIQNEIQKMYDGLTYLEAEVRILKKDGNYLWCRIRGTAQQEENGQLSRVVGVIANIDISKKSMEVLQDQANHDMLTRLLNKTSSQTQIDDFLRHSPTDKRSALIILDLDNFKQVNDRYGHMFGDTILSKSADLFRTLFRGQDIIGRFGGDEFVIFLKHIPTLNLIRQRCSRLLKSFHEQIAQDIPECQLSCSIGISFSPDNGTTFQDLFLCADRALYQAKNYGKNCYVFYDPTNSLPLGPMSISTRLKSDESAVVYNHLSYYTSPDLFEAKNTDNVLNSLLEFVGQHLNISRVSIYENTADLKYTLNTLEWCNKRIPATAPDTKILEYSIVENHWLPLFDSNDTFYAPNTAVLTGIPRETLISQDVKTSIRFLIRHQDRIYGFVGFDECSISREWTPEQIKTLSALARLISAFLLKKHGIESHPIFNQSIERILDHQDSQIYVIDPSSYDLYFSNQKARNTSSPLPAVDHCFEAIAQKNEKCKDCPVQQISDKKHCTFSVENTKTGSTIRTNAISIYWHGKDACMLICDNVKTT